MSTKQNCPQCFRRGYFQENEVCDGCANVDEYYEICVYCDTPNYSNDSNICERCYEIVKNLNSNS